MPPAHRFQTHVSAGTLASYYARYLRWLRRYLADAENASNGDEAARAALFARGTALDGWFALAPCGVEEATGVSGSRDLMGRRTVP